MLSAVLSENENAYVTFISLQIHLTAVKICVVKLI